MRELEDFKAYLEGNGAIIEPAVNEQTALRYRLKSGGPVYEIGRRAEGEVTMPRAALAHYRCFVEGRPLLQAIPAVVLSDPGSCIVCGRVLNREDRTVEHWVARSRGGHSGPANTSWIHKRCNELLANFAVAEKIWIILQVRTIVATLPEVESFDPAKHAPLLWAASRRQSSLMNSPKNWADEVAFVVEKRGA